MKNKSGKITILYMVDVFVKMAGAERNLFEVVTRLDTEKYTPIVMCLHGGQLVEILRGNSKGIEVINLNLDKVYSIKAMREAIKIFKLIKQKNV